MTKPDDVPQDVWDAAVAALDLMPSHGVQMRHHRIENIARAIMAEREACALYHDNAASVFSAGADASGDGERRNRLLRSRNEHLRHASAIRKRGS